MTHAAATSRPTPSRRTSGPFRGARGRVRGFLILAALFAAAAPASQAGAAPWWDALRVQTLEGAPFAPAARWYVVIFIGQDCPVSNGYIPVLNRLAEEFSAKGFAFVGAYVDPTADRAALKAHAAAYAIGFAVADDRDQRLARAAGASYTPEVVVFSAAGAKLYGGRIDDRVGALGAAKPAAAHEELRDVLAALASGAAGPFKGVAGYGCALPEPLRP
jgi:AhpC/TSA family